MGTHDSHAWQSLPTTTPHSSPTRSHGFNTLYLCRSSAYGSRWCQQSSFALAMFERKGEREYRGSWEKGRRLGLGEIIPSELATWPIFLNLYFGPRFLVSLYFHHQQFTFLPQFFLKISIESPHKINLLPLKKCGNMRWVCVGNLREKITPISNANWRK